MPALPSGLFILMEGQLYLLLLLNLVVPKVDTARIYQQPNVVVTASRMPLNNIDAPSKVTSLNVNELETDGFHNVTDMLSTVGGLFMKDYGPAQLQTLSLRGTGAAQTLFLLDGVSLNNIQNGEVDMFLVPTNDLSSIEVSQGGASALYGANAVGGVVSLQSEQFSGNFIRVNLGTGSFGSQTYGGEISEGLGSAQVDLTLQQRRAVNDYGFSFANGSGNLPMKRIGADYLIDNQSLKITIPSSNGRSSLFVQNISDNRGTPGMVTDASFVGTAREIDKNTIAIIKNDGTLGEFDYSVSAGAVYSYLNYIDPSYEENDYYKTLSVQPAAQLSYIGDRFSSAVGIDGEVDRGESDQMIGVKNRNRIGAFFSGMYDVHKGLDLETRIFGAVRFDDYSEFGSSLNPKVGLNIKPFARAPFHLRGSIGTAYRVPTFNDLYYAGLGNTNLKPEKSVEYDFGGIFEFPTRETSLNADLDVSYYHINISDGIVWRPVNTTLWLPENYGKILSQGVEVSLHLNVNTLFSLRGNYSFGKSVDVSDPTDPLTYDKQQLYIPEGQSSLVATLSPGILNFTAVVLYAGKRYYTTDNSASLPAFTVVNLSAGARIGVGIADITPAISIDNLFNQEYEVIYQYPVPGRMYQLQVGFQFNQAQSK